MSHPTLGLPPRDLRAGFPDAAARLRARRGALAARALEVADAADPTLRVRWDEAGLRNLLRDAEALADRLALCVAGGDSHWLKLYAEQAAIVWRRRRVPMDDSIALLEGLRAAARGVLDPAEMVPADAALDAGIEALRWYRRLAGDARKRNRLLAFIYKGA